jgi:hypothetical protein
MDDAEAGVGEPAPPLLTMAARMLRARASDVARDLIAGVVAAVLLIANIVSFGALMFPGELADGAPLAVWAMLIGKLHRWPVDCARHIPSTTGHRYRLAEWRGARAREHADRVTSPEGRGQLGGRCSVHDAGVHHHHGRVRGGAVWSRYEPLGIARSVARGLPAGRLASSERELEPAFRKEQVAAALLTPSPAPGYRGPTSDPPEARAHGRGPMTLALSLKGISASDYPDRFLEPWRE